jgi:hypothetical protein
MECLAIGKLFTNVELLAKGQLIYFYRNYRKIADANPTDLLYTDQIEFDLRVQTVELVTLIQDAVLYPKRLADDGTTESLPIGQEKSMVLFR